MLVFFVVFVVDWVVVGVDGVVWCGVVVGDDVVGFVCVGFFVVVWLLFVGVVGVFG